MELAGGVVLPDEGLEITHPGVGLLERCGWKGEELAPVGTRIERGEFGFDLREDFFDGGPLGLPGEVDGEGVALVGHGEPEVVLGDGAELGGEEVWGDLTVEGFDGGDGGEGLVAGDEVLGLEFGAAGGSEVHLEVREALVPGAWDVHLRGAVDGVEGGDGVEVFGGELCVVEEGGVSRVCPG